MKKVCYSLTFGKAIRFKSVLILCCFCFISVSNIYGQDLNENVLRSQRAIFIFNFAQQIGWPNIDQLSTFTIGVLGTDPIIIDLGSMAQRRKIFAKPVEVLRFQNVKDIKNVQLLYVNQKYSYDLSAIFKIISEKNTLLVTENYNYNSSMINMIGVGNSFEYEINTQRIENENLIIAPSLKKYAISSINKWKKLYESTQFSLEKTEEDIKQKETIIQNKEKQIEGITHEVKDRDNVIQLLFDKTELQRKKYNEKVQIAIELEQKIQEQASIIQDQQKAIVNKGEDILKSNNTITEQQKILSNLENEIKEKESFLSQRLAEINTQKKFIWLLIILVVIFLLGAFIIFKGYLIQKNLRRQIETKNIEVKKQAKKLIEKNKELRKKNYQINEQSKTLESQNNDLEQFAYIASHDLQEPLNTISSFIGLLVTEYGDRFDDVAKNSLEYINDASIRMKKLINSLLEYSRLGRSKDHCIVSCSTLIDELRADLKSAIERTKAKINVHELPEVNGSEIELRLLFQNLISNAMKFTKPEVIPEIFISCQENKEKNGASTNFWEFSVRDNGIGIPEKQKHKIFDLFQRLHSREEYKGTGIGLAHCKKIVESHGGNLWIDSVEHKGSTFYFTIPMKN